MAWDGIDRNTGELYDGSFTYKILMINNDGKAFELRGQACAMTCNPLNAAIVSREDCFFPEQFDGDMNRLDQSLSVELDCF